MMAMLLMSLAAFILAGTIIMFINPFAIVSLHVIIFYFFKILFNLVRENSISQKAVFQLCPENNAIQYK